MYIGKETIHAIQYFTRDDDAFKSCSRPSSDDKNGFTHAVNNTKILRYELSKLCFHGLYIFIKNTGPPWIALYFSGGGGSFFEGGCCLAPTAAVGDGGLFAFIMIDDDAAEDGWTSGNMFG
jgi:hypothetical protein